MAPLSGSESCRIKWLILITSILAINKSIYLAIQWVVSSISQCFKVETSKSPPGMIASTLITTKNLPFEIKHCVLGATCAKNPKSDLGKAMASYLKTVQAAGKKPDPREMSEVMTKVSQPFYIRPCMSYLSLNWHFSSELLRREMDT